MLQCSFEQTADDTIGTTWIVPDGSIIFPGFQPGQKYFVTQTEAGVSILLIQRLSYTDEGEYTCVAEDLSSPESLPGSATIELQLLGKVTR